MGFKIGLPCLKLNNCNRKSAKNGNFASVASEALAERRGKDSDIDRTKTDENLYTGFRSAEELMEYSRQHVAELSAKQKADGKRGIREDAVVMCVTIIKPPAVYMHSLTQDDQVRFLRDAETKFNELVGGSQNNKASVIHFDEQGAHMHIFWEPFTADGRLCAKDMMTRNFLCTLNREMPAYLRAKGWDIDDCEAFEQAKKSLEAEKEKSAERKAHGLTSLQYKAQAEAEKNRLYEEIDTLKEEAQRREKAVTETASRIIDTAKSQVKQILTEADNLKSENLKLEKERLKMIEELDKYNDSSEKIANVVAIKARAKEKKHLGKESDVVLKKTDFDNLTKQANAGASLVFEVKRLKESEERLKKDLKSEKSWLSELTSEMSKLKKENAELKTFRDRVEAFFRHSKLVEKFQEFCEGLNEKRLKNKIKTIDPSDDLEL